jgi:hypothetical protein
VLYSSDSEYSFYMSTICYKQVNLAEVAEKGKCDNNGESKSK